MFYDLITEQKIYIEYFEDGPEAQLRVVYNDEETEKFFTENPEALSELNDYVEKALIVASYAGFEPPTDFYKAIKSYVESEGSGEL